MDRVSNLNRAFSKSSTGTLFFLVALLGGLFLNPAQAQLTVTTNVDDNNAGSLRHAIANVVDGGTITFSNDLSGKTIRLLLGHLTINKNLTIDGSSLAEPVTISGDKDESGTPSSGDSRIFDIVTGGYDVSLRSLIIEGGYKQSSGAGGGIQTVDAFLTIQDTTITKNFSSGGSNGYPGGGIYQKGGVVTIVNSTISHNGNQEVSSSGTGGTTGGSGGGIFSEGGTLNFQNCTITENHAATASNGSSGTANGGKGGGVYIHSSGTLNMDSCTVVSNYAGDSVPSTGSENPGDGGGIYIHGSATVSIGNSIIAENYGGSATGGDGEGADISKNVSATLNRVGQNLIGDNDTVETAFPVPNENGDLVGTMGSRLFPQLQPLADNGGRTMTMMPYFDSIVVNAGIATDRPQDTTDINWNANFAELLPVDQTGSPRVSGEEIDLGAFEYQFPAPEMQSIVNPLKVATLNKISKLKKKIKKLSKKGKKAKAKKVKKKLKKLQKRLASL